ncbi:tubulin binding cofactor C [Sodiomyces alkalinus F11]|uniref:Tubulin binding cofactor C n=1 Tax=Sodiomyces alkalinus (strain CBS 110278 / VKM F-3762 / F11) TaxID=1314773 RepID=A0A3N2PN06_SODAK|nr:tubulin binding cofactor C [Sodiomyces alkalinus F11]ROT35810.1 tubulin binding cofactor C [Sodiomyces alkalinus F11]
MAPDVIQPVAVAAGPHVVTPLSQDPKEKFYRHFQEEFASIRNRIEDLPSVAVIGGERQDALDAILGSISNLSNEVSDASDYVPAYDQRTYSEAIKLLTEKLNQTTAKLAPRSRFQFKSRSAAAGSDQALGRAADPRLLTTAGRVDATPASPDETADPSSRVEAEDAVSDLPSIKAKDYNKEMAQPSTSRVRMPSFSTAKEIVIFGQTGLHIILPSTASRATSAGRLTDINDCVVDMSMVTASSAPFASLMLNNIRNSLVLAGHVDGPVHITGVSDSIVVVAARQVRIHECKNVDLYLDCSSHPIIEDCSGMRFAPLPPSFENPDDPSKNQWDQVQDFKWLKSEKSPNWSILPEGERIAEDIWVNVVPGKPGKDLSDILDAVGIARR